MTIESPSVVEPSPAATTPATISDTNTEPQIVTSAEEVEGFHAIKAILRDAIQPKRITMRDAQSYCAILLDDNNRKPICRLRFNNLQNLRVGIFNDKKEEILQSIETVDDIFNLANQIKATALAYESKE